MNVMSSFRLRGFILATALLALPVPALAASQQIAATSHLLWLKPDGTVWASGDQDDGARGDSKAPEVRNEFEPIPGLKDVVQVAARDNQSVALKADGTVWVWGMFDGMEPYDKPKPLPGLTDVKAIAAGADFVVALKRDGTVWLAGSGGDNGLRTDDSSKPVAIAGLADVVAVGATDWAAFAAKKDGSVWGWGNGFARLLGAKGKWSILDMGTAHHPKPLLIEGVGDVVALSGGNAHMLALTRDGKIWAWGDNEDGALGVRIVRGLGDTAYQLPARIEGLPKITAISAGYDFSLALDSEGKVWSWGGNTYGALGVSGDAEESRVVPKPVQGIDKAVSVHGGHYHGFAVLADGKVLGWGSNQPDFIQIVPKKPSEYLPPTPVE